MKQVVYIFCLLFFFISFSKAENTILPQADSIRIVNDLQKITKTEGYRNYQNLSVLNSVADYIFNELSKTCDSVYFQPYLVDGVTYKNVVGSIGLDKKERLIIGAHYDVCGEQEGADDNASGITGVLELSRLLQNDTLPFRVDFVAFSLEEPPFFSTQQMGSFIHAKYLADNKIPVKGMICLDMIGYFSDKEDSQSYPISLLSNFYGSTGDYILIVQRFGNGDFGDKVYEHMLKAKLIKTQAFKSFSQLPGVDSSDHRNYWIFDINAVNITNTAFFRNHNYHQETDKMETLNIGKMKLVIDEVLFTIRMLK